MALQPHDRDGAALKHNATARSQTEQAACASGAHMQCAVHVLHTFYGPRMHEHAASARIKPAQQGCHHVAGIPLSCSLATADSATTAAALDGWRDHCQRTG